MIVPQTREQMSGPDLHHIYTQIFSPKKTGFFTFFGIMQLFSVDAIVFSKKKFLTPKK